MRIMRASLILLWLLAAFNLECAELHAVLLIDSEAENIENAMMKNHRLWQKQLLKISGHTDMRIREHCFIGKHLLSKEVFSCLRALEVDEDDVVLLYFCGHGYRTHRKTNPWPYMCWSHENIAVDFMILTDCLKKKNPRLLIAFAECCNNYIEAQNYELVQESVMSNRRMIMQSNYRKLFLETEGVIVVSSSHPGEFSWAWVERGSCFTLAFFECLEKEVKNRNGTEWAIIFESASLKVNNLQSPQYILDIADDGF